MSVLYPQAGYLLLLAIPIILCFFIRSRLQQKPVTSMMLWQQVLQNRKSRSIKRWLRWFSSIMIALTFLALLVLALAEPLSGSRAQNELIIFVLDNSASMQAPLGPGQPSRWQAACDELFKSVSVIQGREIIVLQTAPRAHVVVERTVYVPEMIRKVQALKPVDSPGRLKETIALAERIRHPNENTRIFVLTDQDFAAKDDAPVQVIRTAQSIDNLAITGFQVRRNLRHSTEYEVHVETVWYGSDPVEARLELDLNDRIVDTMTLQLEPNRPQSTMIRSASPLGGILRLRLTPDDLFPLDNQAVSILPEYPKRNLYCFLENHFFLLQALRAQPNVQLHVGDTQPDQTTDKGSPEVSPEESPEESLFVYAGQVPESLPEKGHFLIVAPRNSCELFTLEGESYDIEISEQKSKDSSVKTALTGTAYGVMPLKVVGRPDKQLTGIDGTPLILTWNQPERKVILLNLDPEQVDFALKTVFPLLVTRLLDEFHSGHAHPGRVFSTGERVSVPWPQNDSTVLLQGPEGEREELHSQAGQLIFGPLTRTGIWRIGEMPLACNLLDSTESDLRCTGSTTPALGGVALSGLAAASWLLPALCALILGAVEWFLYQRRWID